MKFKPGDVCEIIDGEGFNLLREYIGRECVVDGAYPTPDLLNHPEWNSYVVWIDGYRVGFYEHCLRLKRPPEWDKWIHDTSKVDDEEQLEIVRTESLANYIALRSKA